MGTQGRQWVGVVEHLQRGVTSVSTWDIVIE